MTETVVGGIIKVVLIETVTGIVTRIDTGRETGIGNGIEIGIVTVKEIETETGTEEGIEIGTEIEGRGTVVDLVVIQGQLAGRGAHQTPGHRLHTGTVQEPDPGHIQLRVIRNAPGTGSRHPRVPIGHLVRSHQGTDARTEQLAQGGILFHDLNPLT